MRVLLTGFDPFGGESVNPSYEAARLVRAPAGVELTVAEIPTVFGESLSILNKELRSSRPDAVLLLGQAAGRRALTPERIAVNCEDARIPDNAGCAPQDVPVIPGAPAAYFSTLPIRRMTEAIRAAGVPAEISNTAGTFVCNALMFGLLHTLATEYPGVRGGFLHVPCIPEQAGRMPEGTFTLPLPEIARGLEAAIRAIAES